jgi:hypothetical protein
MSTSGTSDVYTQGDIVLQHPVEASTTFLFVILISAVLEFCIDSAADVDNKYFRVMFQAVNQEVMIVGLLVLSCSFAQTVYSWPDRWILIFQWAMMVLFFMAIFFVSLVMFVLGAVNFTSKRWLLFEVEKMDSGESLSGREAQYKLAFIRFQSALQAFGYDSSMGIRFSEYLAKLMRRNIVSLTDLTWVCWVCLATLVILNTLRSEATRQLSQIGDENLEDEQTDGQRVLQYLSFILVIGYGVLLLFLIIHHTLSRRLDNFLSKQKRPDNEQAMTAMSSHDHGGEQGLITRDDLEDSTAHLFRRSREATMELLQVIILSLEWFTATFFLSFSNEIVTYLGWYAAAPLFLLAALPAIIFSVMLPWTLTVITLLSSLGTNLDEDSVRYLIIKAGVPEAAWPPHMREALRRARDEERGGASAVPDNNSDNRTLISAMNNASFANFSFAGGLSFVGPPAAQAAATQTRSGGVGGARSNASATDYRQEERDRDSSSSPSRPLPRGIGAAYPSQRDISAQRGVPPTRTDAYMNL